MKTPTGHERRLLTAFFDTRAEAERAAEDLISAGFARRDIRLVPQFEGSPLGVGVDPTPKSFWEMLKDHLFPNEDRATYAEGIRRGGILLSVTTIGSDHSVAASILDRDGAVDMASRQQKWESEGWEREEPASEGAESDLPPRTSRETLRDVLRYRSYIFQD